MKHQLDTEDKLTKVLYAGYLPVFGSTGSHPQFHNLTNFPSRYEFVYIHLSNFLIIAHFVASKAKSLFFAVGNKAKWNKVVRSLRIKNIQLQLKEMYRFNNLPSGCKVIRIGFCNLWGAFRLIFLITKFFLSAIRNGAKPFNVIKFVWTRGIWSQLHIPMKTRLVFLPSFPFILCQIPWIIEIEDTTTLFAPFVLNGQTSSLNIFENPYYSFVKTLIESDTCKGIICHIKSTAESIPLLFNNEKLNKKIIHLPLGIPLSPPELLSRKKQKDVIDILFTNSWHQNSDSFYLRGGLDILEAFSILFSKYSNVRLTLRTALPVNLNDHYLKIIKDCSVKILDKFLPDEAMHELMLKADIYVLPSARIHVVSILEAMAYGLAVVVSDGWGNAEYVEDGRNGIVVRGRYGKCSWMDINGVLREDYKPLFSSDPIVVKGLVDSLSALIEDRELCEKLGQTARKDIETKFSMDNWNQGLAKALDQALS